MRALTAGMGCALLLALGSFAKTPTARAGFDKVVGAAKGAGAGTAAIAPGPRKTAVILFNFSGDSGQPWSAAGARSEVFTGSQSVNAFYEEESYGAISLSGDLRPDGDVFGWFTLNAPTGGCPYQEWVKKADDAATKAGAALSSYQNLIYMFPLQFSCPWSGLAGVSSGTGPINGGGPVGALINGDSGVHVVIHEVGHTFGLQHAGNWTCTSGGVRVQISNSCSTAEYGDPFDAMGNAPTARHNSGWNLAKLGILQPENIETIEASGTYSMRSALHPTTDPTVLRIPRDRAADGDVTSWYYLEVRESGGVFESVGDATDTGVSIRVAPNPAGSPETLLLDANPATATFQDAPLAAGETFDGGPVRVKTLAAGSGSAAVAITLDEEPPTAPTGLTATGGEEKVRLQWSASSDDFGVERYRVFRDGSEVGTTAGTGFDDAPAPVGDHEYLVYAEDATGNLSAASDPAMATAVPDEAPPTKPAHLTATTGTKGVELEWDPSSDNVGVESYVVFRDGSELASPAEASSSIPSPRSAVTNTSSTRKTRWAIAASRPTRRRRRSRESRDHPARAVPAASRSGTRGRRRPGRCRPASPKPTSRWKAPGEGPTRPRASSVAAPRSSRPLGPWRPARTRSSASGAPEGPPPQEERAASTAAATGVSAAAVEASAR